MSKEVPEVLHKALKKGFPTQTVIIDLGREGTASEIVNRDIAGYRCRLQIKIGQTILTDFEEIKDE